VYIKLDVYQVREDPVYLTVSNGMAKPSRSARGALPDVVACGDIVVTLQEPLRGGKETYPQFER